MLVKIPIFRRYNVPFRKQLSTFRRIVAVRSIETSPSTRPVTQLVQQTVAVLVVDTHAKADHVVRVQITECHMQSGNNSRWRRYHVNSHT